MKQDERKKAAKRKSVKANPTAGLRKWQKKALREEAKAEKENATSAAAAAAVKAKGKRKLERLSTIPTPKEAEVAVPGAPKLTKKEARQRAVQEKQHKALFASGERILLIGEGNFSFACQLCEHLQDGRGIFATAFDGEASLNRKYSDAAAARKNIEEKFGGTTLVGVDATRIHRVKEFRNAFSKIVWNFPHMGAGEKDVAKSIEDHKKLLFDFFKSAVKCLDPEKNASIHVALKAGEPYKSWRIVQVLKEAAPDLELQTVVPFALHAWPGYSHRRTLGFSEKFSKKDSEELAKGAKVYVFGRQKLEPEDEDKGDEDS